MRIEAGTVECSVSNLVRLCLAIGLPVGALVEDATLLNIGFNQAHIPDEVGKLLAAPSKKAATQRLRRYEEFLFAHFHAARRVVTDSTPFGVVRDSGFTRDDTKVRYMVFASMVEGFTNVERVATLSSLQNSPYAKLKSLALISTAMLADFLNGDDSALGIQFNPTPAAIKPNPRKPFLLVIDPDRKPS